MYNYNNFLQMAHMMRAALMQQCRFMGPLEFPKEADWEEVLPAMKKAKVMIMSNNHMKMTTDEGSSSDLGQRQESQGQELFDK